MTTISPEFEYLMRIVGDCAAGRPLSHGSVDVDKERLLSLAREQGVIVMAAAMLQQDEHLPSQLRDRCEALYYRRSADELQRRRHITELIARLEQEGIPVIVLKGFSAARRYAEPMTRISGDVDLFVSPKDERKALRLLESSGFAVTPRATFSHHSECVHPGLGELELHIALYEDNAERLWFQGISTANGQSVRVKTECGEFSALAPNDELLFIALHLVKHFVSGGIGLRMICVLALCHADAANANYLCCFHEQLSRLGLDAVVSYALCIADRYMGIPFTGDFMPDEDMLLSMCRDCERGGVFGFNDFENRVSSSASARVKLSEKRNAAYLANRARKLLLYQFRRVFPPFRTLSEEYPIVKERRLLTPFIWCKRTALHTVNVIKRKPQGGKAAAPDPEREQLLHSLGL